MFPKKVHYGLRFLLILSGAPEDCHLSVAEIAEREELSVKFLEAIAVALRKQDVVNVRRGAGGGYKLARPLREISLFDIVRALDEKADKEMPVERNNAEKAVGRFLTHVRNDYGRLLRKTSLEKLKNYYAEENDKIMYYI